jgi:glyoxylase-like metal-dependent hydrolase (beta-lactamase superfamily II)
LAQATPAHTFKHGAFEITVLSDGNLILPTPVLAIGTDRKQLDAALADAGQGEDRVEPPCNVTLVCSAAGITRDSVTKVVFKHAHPDPIWGTHDEFDDAPNFHYATYVITENERNFWRGSDVAAKMPVHRQSLIPGAKRNLSQIKDRFETIEPGTDIVLGGRTIDIAGLIAIEVASGNDAMLVVGDAIAHPTIAFAHPDWKPDADHDADRAVATRKSLLDRLAADRSRIIGYHLPFPGIGRVERKGTAYAYVSGG